MLFDIHVVCVATNRFCYMPTEGDWVVADMVLPKMKKLIIYGTLEIDDQKDPATGRVREFVLEATYVYIRGGRLLAGWEDSPFTGKLDILLNGNHRTPDFKLNNDDDGPNIGSKAIGKLAPKCSVTLAPKSLISRAVKMAPKWLVHFRLQFIAATYQTLTGHNLY